MRWMLKSLRLGVVEVEAAHRRRRGHRERLGEAQPHFLRVEEIEQAALLTVIGARPINRTPVEFPGNARRSDRRCSSSRPDPNPDSVHS
jgi:hypothetical protein